MIKTILDYTKNIVDLTANLTEETNIQYIFDIY
jgi:hypothetical protein